eukprot:Gb_35215 [translate_table: standard]
MIRFGVLVIMVNGSTTNAELVVKATTPLLGHSGTPLAMMTPCSMHNALVYPNQKMPNNLEELEVQVVAVVCANTAVEAAAYYYHGLILDEGNGENSHAKAVASLRAAEHFLKESKKACTDFCLASPVTSVPPPWGAMKYLSEKIPKDASNKARINSDVYGHERQEGPGGYPCNGDGREGGSMGEEELLKIRRPMFWNIGNKGRLPENAPLLPDFSVALKPDEYVLPPIDPSWNEEAGT